MCGPCGVCIHVACMCVGLVSGRGRSGKPQEIGLAETENNIGQVTAMPEG